MNIAAEFLVISAGDAHHADNLPIEAEGDIHADARAGIFPVRPHDETLHVLPYGLAGGRVHCPDAGGVRARNDAPILVHEVDGLADRVVQLGYDAPGNIQFDHHGEIPSLSRNRTVFSSIARLGAGCQCAG